MISSFSMKQTQNVLNLSCLPVLSEELVLQVLQNNYMNNRFYTWAGKTLLAINPCTSFEYLYTQEMIDHYRMSENKDNEPHIYAVAEIARYMLSSGLGKVNQAIIVSGESGAGKTYGTAHILEYLTTVASSSYFRTVKFHQPEKIQQQIIDSTPLLEAFGNASTSRNRNSSRFGKFIQLQYYGAQFAGAKISTYLLEKTRVATAKKQTERNYNIFYQIVAGSSPAEHDEWMLDSTIVEALLTDATDTDKKKYFETRHAMDDIGLSKTEQKDIFQVLSTILHLKELKFRASLLDDSIVEIDENNEVYSNLEKAAVLLGIELSKLKYVLTVKTIVAGRTSRKSVFSKPCSDVGECQARRDCLIKLLYDRLFEWLVSFINREVSAISWDSFIGILDIYGFESFDYNSLEQLCINFANEKLQQYFVRDFLHDEQALFAEEGIEFSLVDYTDNRYCLEILEGRTKASVFGLLNEDCQLHWQNDPISVTKKLLETLKESSYLEASASNKGKAMNSTTDFIIRHYAGKVKYSAEEMIDKNKDNIPAEFLAMLANSSKIFISELSPKESGRLTPDKKIRKQTVLSKFKASLDNLVDILNLCDAHYIRCLVPNVLCQPSSLDLLYLSRQLKACGILESIAVSQTGLPVRMSYGSFVKHYSPLFGKNVKYLERLVRLMDERNASFESNEEKGGSESSVLKQACHDMINNLLGTRMQKNYQFGKTKLFLSSKMFHQLEKVLSECHFRMARLIQCAWRRYSRIRMQKERATIVIQKEFRRWIVQRDFILKKNAAIILQRAFRAYLHRQQQINAYLNTDLSEDQTASFCSCSNQDALHSNSDDDKTSLVFFSGDEGNIEQSLLQDSHYIGSNEEELTLSLGNCHKVNNNQYLQQGDCLDRIQKSLSNNFPTFQTPFISTSEFNKNRICDNFKEDLFNVGNKCTYCFETTENEKGSSTSINFPLIQNCLDHSRSVSHSVSFSDSDHTLVNLSSNEILDLSDITGKTIYNIVDWTKSMDINSPKENLNFMKQQHKPAKSEDSNNIVKSPSNESEENAQLPKECDHKMPEALYNEAYLRSTFNGKHFDKLLKFVPATRYKQQSKQIPSFPCRLSVNSNTYNKTPHLYSKDGLISIRRMPTTTIRFHTRPTVLPYSHIPPISEVRCSLADALENEKHCLLHEPCNRNVDLSC